jgi:hypothetical protein
MGLPHTLLLLHNICWLSQKNISMNHGAENRSKNVKKKEVFDTAYWLTKLAYLSGIFSILNELQGLQSYKTLYIHAALSGQPSQNRKVMETQQ